MEETTNQPAPEETATEQPKPKYGPASFSLHSDGEKFTLDANGAGKDLFVMFANMIDTQPDMLKIIGDAVDAVREKRKVVPNP